MKHRRRRVGLMIACAVSEELAARPIPDLDQVYVVDDVVTQMTLHGFKRFVSEMAVLSAALHDSAARARMPRRWACAYESKLSAALAEFLDGLDVAAVERQIEERVARMVDDERHRPLFAPGRKVPLRPANAEWDLSWDDDYDGIRATPTMFVSHLFASYHDAIERATGDCDPGGAPVERL